ncbi:MAG: hypothetical protein NTX22_09475 [Ignavibacteriales bacterium]|nr:hypothetical protein [Ignavibacteriales bacterium]
MKNILVILFSLLFYTNISLCADFSLKIGLDKKEYLRYEPVEILVTLQNIDLKEVEIDADFESFTDIIVTDSYGKQLKRTWYWTVDSRHDIKYKLLPGKSITYSTSLSREYGNESKVKYYLCRNVFNTFLPGKYQVKLKYSHYYLDAFNKSKKEEFYSNTKEFIINEPTVKDDKIVLEKLNNIILKYDKIKKDNNSISKWVDELILLVEKFPNSNYEMCIYNNIVEEYRLINYEIPKILIDKFLDKYPSSSIVFNYASTLFNRNKSLYNSNEYKEKLQPSIKKMIEENNEFNKSKHKIIFK